MRDEIDADPFDTLRAAGMSVQVSPDFDAYASGRLDLSQVRCVLCKKAPCGCPPFGSDEYIALCNQLHGK